MKRDIPWAVPLFQSAMRIFGVSNEVASQGPQPMYYVSIRHADFRCFQRTRRLGTGSRQQSFNPPCGFSVFPTAAPTSVLDLLSLFQSAMRIFGVSNPSEELSPLRPILSFNPPCGFSVFPTPWRPARSDVMACVSIRHADFRCFQQFDDNNTCTGIICFNPPCGFSVFPTGSSATMNTPSGWFQSAMRIFGVSNLARGGGVIASS